MNRAIIIIVLFGLHSLLLSAQSSQRVDSISRSTSELIQLSWQLQVKGKYDSSIMYANRATGLASQVGLFKEQAIANQYAGESFMRLHIRDSAIKYLNRALTISVEHNLREFEAGVFNSLANVDLNENRYENALKNFIRSANIYDSLDNKAGLAKALSNIGNIEYRLGHLDKAVDYARQSKDLSLSSDHTSGVGYAHKLIGWIYRKKGMLDEALSQYDSALIIYKRLGSNRDVAEVALSIGNAYFDKGVYPRAISHYEQSIDATRLLDYEPFLPYAYSGLAYSYFSIQNNVKALAYADSLENTSANVNPNLLLDAYDLKSSIFERLADFRNALTYKNKYQALSDSLTAIENRQAIEDAEAKYQNDLKQREIDQLKQEKSLRESRTKIIWIATAGGIVLVIVITALLVNRFIIINRSTRLLEIERMRNSIARDLHDDIGSALSSINIMSKVALRDMQPEAAQQTFSKIGDQSAKVMESMSDIVWSINPENDSAEKLMSKMREFAVEILEPLNIQFYFHHPEATHFTLDASQRKNLFLIYKEAVNNAAKYSNCKTIQVSISSIGKQLTLTIEDDGIGFDIENVGRGNGLNNMAQRASALNGELQIQSQIGKGTSIKLAIHTT
ncbi:MAG TPA: tetratricopeptide repeat protein [Cyclobacteriaceae bacterium]|nr:tetratricopeptide repeat protein [Cyclobacteriaceae bacterium]